MPNNANVYYEYLVNHVLAPFYAARQNKIEGLALNTILKSKNPYLFRAKNIEIAGALIKGIVDAYLSSQEETMFGNLLEGFAIHIAETLYGGFKSGFKSIDLEFQREGIYYIVGIKSGTAWGNADQITAMKTHFKEAKQKLRTEFGINGEIIAVNGCMYGRESTPFKGATGRGVSVATIDQDKAYYKYAGQDFWQFISGDENFYREMIIPIGNAAKGKDEIFQQAYSGTVNKLTQEFMERFVDPDNGIDWGKLVDFVSKRKDKGRQ